MSFAARVSDDSRIFYMRVTRQDSEALDRLSIAWAFAGWRDGWLGSVEGATDYGLKRKLKHGVWALRRWAKTKDWYVEGLFDIGLGVAGNSKRIAKLETYVAMGSDVHLFNSLYFKQIESRGVDAAAYLAGVGRSKPADWADW